MYTYAAKLWDSSLRVVFCLRRAKPYSSRFASNVSFAACPVCRLPHPSSRCSVADDAKRRTQQLGNERGGGGGDCVAVPPPSSGGGLLAILAAARDPSSVSVPAAPVERSRASPPHRPREDELTHHADTSRSNLAEALGLLSSGGFPNPLTSQASPAAAVRVQGRAGRVADLALEVAVQHALGVQVVQRQHQLHRPAPHRRLRHCGPPACAWSETQ
jgi:hypothetical protein